MKPGDHPEFFRFPPPEGRSRESRIVLQRDGRFFHEGAAVEHLGMRKAFASWLRRHPDDGRFILSNGYDWSYVTVEGPERFVSSARALGDAAGVELELFDGEVVALDPKALACDAEGRLWLHLSRGEPACFTAAAQLQLSPWLVERQGQIGIELGGQIWPIAGAESG